MDVILDLFFINMFCEFVRYPVVALTTDATIEGESAGMEPLKKHGRLINNVYIIRNKTLTRRRLQGTN